MLVAIGRLEVKPGTNLLRFLWHTLRALMQAKRAAGCLHATTRRGESNVFWSMSLWSTREAMLAYRNSGAHAKAMRAAREFTRQVRFTHWEAAEIPTWEEAMRRAQL